MCCVISSTPGKAAPATCLPREEVAANTGGPTAWQTPHQKQRDTVAKRGALQPHRPRSHSDSARTVCTSGQTNVTFLPPVPDKSQEERTHWSSTYITPPELLRRLKEFKCLKLSLHIRAHFTLPVITASLPPYSIFPMKELIYSSLKEVLIVPAFY